MSISISELLRHEVIWKSGHPKKQSIVGRGMMLHSKKK